MWCCLASATEIRLVRRCRSIANMHCILSATERSHVGSRGVQLSLQLRSRPQTAGAGDRLGIAGERLVAPGGAADQVQVAIVGPGVVGVGGERRRGGRTPGPDAGVGRSRPAGEGPGAPSGWKPTS